MKIGTNMLEYAARENLRDIYRACAILEEIQSGRIRVTKSKEFPRQGDIEMREVNGAWQKA